MRFVIPGPPQGKGRPRFSTYGGAVRTHTPQKTVAYENLVKLEYERQCNGRRFADDSLLSVEIVAFFSMPKNVSKVKRAAMLEGKIRPTKKPDVDNIAKIICDSLNGIAYHDDKQIVKLIVYKYYASIPRVTVCISEVEKDGDGF